MKKVRIHVVDSLPYQTDYKKILENVFKGDGIRKMLESDARKGNEFAKFARREWMKLLLSGSLRIRRRTDSET
jgi:hypothetical protein